MNTVKSERELLEAVKNKQCSIVIEGNLVNKTIRLQAVGNVAWAIALAEIGLSIYYVVSILEKGKLRAANHNDVYSMFSEYAILAVALVVSLIAIVTAVIVLRRLKNYKLIGNNNGQLILKRKVK
ncbi:hypothetical protein OQ483_24645 (plasmid) [Enterobacter bugandensis]|uniref:hypothetical protein n=1 Tax=Enterobacter bugandensis TaxID=881260 RepID=UPI00283AB31A|nr:hypothetical protein [Enterobacter bugandensis]WMU75298.1 hypothetical protein OQ483_24645 [Enterobacter bugandensis]